MKLALQWNDLATAAPREGPAAGAARRLRTWLLVGCAVSAALAYAVARAVMPASPADADLQLLMRGMALVKACIALAALAAVLWRLGRPLSARLAAVYLAGVWVLAAGPVFIWHVALIPATAVVFHLGELALLIAAWRDGLGAYSFSRRGGRELR